MFVGRGRELDILNAAYRTTKSELVVLYGRRRIGKSSLVKQFAKDKPEVYSFEAIEGERTTGQIAHFTELLRQQVPDTVLQSVTFTAGEPLLDYVTKRILNKRRRGKKLVLFFDEIQWMAAGRSKLISLLKYYWDNRWNDSQVMLILCGSIASFMVKKVIHSKALYGRITVEMLLKGLMPHEAAALFRKRRSPEETLNYLLVFGAVPSGRASTSTTTLR